MHCGFASGGGSQRPPCPAPHSDHRVRGKNSSNDIDSWRRSAPKVKDIYLDRVVDTMMLSSGSLVVMFPRAQFAGAAEKGKAKDSCCRLTWGRFYHRRLRGCLQNKACESPQRSFLLPSALLPPSNGMSPTSVPGQSRRRCRPVTCGIPYGVRPFWRDALSTDSRRVDPRS